ncbi:MAG: hypothetical protein CM15mP77_4180 [Synechococcus sp.]|nr:MAG: hypothetical protein CM15mP77_4180 [Synechococcus sp.]
MATAAARVGLNLVCWPCEQEMLSKADGSAAYQSAGRQPQQLATALSPWPAPSLLAIADEAHHLGLDPDEPGAAAWSQA